MPEVEVSLVLTLNPIILHLLAEPDVFKEVKQKLDLGSVKFEVCYDLSKEDSSSSRNLVLSLQSIKFLFLIV